MKWVTRLHIRVNRAATAWLIRRFIDPEATFISTPEGAGWRAISRGFPLVAQNDLESLERATFLYDALYASLREEQRVAHPLDDCAAN